MRDYEADTEFDNNDVILDKDESEEYDSDESFIVTDEFDAETLRLMKELGI